LAQRYNAANPTLSQTQLNIMEKELTDRADAIHQRITQLRDSL
jgi:hypothetical protein